MQPLWKTVWQFLNKVNRDLPYHPAISLLDINPKELKERTWTDIFTSVFTAALFTTAKKVETIQMCMDESMDKQNVVGTYTGILFSLKKKWNSDKCNMEETWRHYAKWNKQDIKGQI